MSYIRALFYAIKNSKTCLIYLLTIFMLAANLNTFYIISIAKHNFIKNQKRSVNDYRKQTRTLDYNYTKTEILNNLPMIFIGGFARSGTTLMRYFMNLI